jgi:hypothetical protein
MPSGEAIEVNLRQVAPFFEATDVGVVYAALEDRLVASLARLEAGQPEPSFMDRIPSRAELCPWQETDEERAQRLKARWADMMEDPATISTVVGMEEHESSLETGEQRANDEAQAWAYGGIEDDEQ